MIGKLLVLAAIFGGLWLLLKLLGRIGQQNKELQIRRQKDAMKQAHERAAREADIIDLEEDPETGAFREK